MPAVDDQIDDIAYLATRLLAVYGTDGPDGILQLTDLDPDSGSHVAVIVDIDTESAAGAGAFLTLLKLCVDAAAVAVEYVDRTGHISGGGVDEALLRELARSDLVGLELVYLREGSLVGRLRIVLKTPKTRRVSLAVCTLAGTLLAVVLPPVGAVVGIVAAGGALVNEIVTPDEMPSSDVPPTVDRDALQDVRSADVIFDDEDDLDEAA
jgi:hypothetical protein